MADLLSEVCERVFISVRMDQQEAIAAGYTTLVDSVDGAGPIVAILSALKAHPDKAWLVVACDLPLLDKDTLQYLVDNRNTSTIATTFRSPFDQLPEPLITIWEPGSYDVLQAHIADGYRCPRKALIRNGEQVTLLSPPDADALMNANTPEDAARVRELLQHRSKAHG